MTVATIKCPYCQFDIPQAAIVCGHCTKDISLIKPLWAQYSELLNEISSLKLSVEELKIKSEKRNQIDELHQADLSISIDESPPRSLVPKKIGTSAYLSFALTLVFGTTILVFLHWLLLFVYDTNLLFLRLLTVVIPFLVGTVIFRKVQLHWLASLLGALALGSMSVFGMLAVTSHIDNVALLPDNARDWREVGEYVFAVSCAFITGLLIENWRESHQANLKKSINLRLLIEKDESGQFKAPEWTTQVQSLFTAMAPFVSAGTAIVSGVRVFTG